MKLFTPLRSTACVVALLSASAAHADVTVTDVWDDLKENFTAYGEDGYSIGSETQDGDTMTIADIVVSTGDDITNTTINYGTIVLTDLGDGTVSVQMDDPIQMVLESSPAYDATNTLKNIVTMSLTADGLVMTASGNPKDLSYDFSADKYAFVVDQITDGSTTVKADIRFNMNGIDGNYTSKTGELRDYVYDVAVASADMLVDVTPPETAGDYVTFSGKVDDIAMKFTATMPRGENVTKPEDIFTAGFKADGGYTYGQGNYIFDMKAEGEQTSGSISVAKGSLTGSMDQNALSYDSLINDIAVKVNGAGMPMPIEFGLAESGFGFDMPLGQSEDEADFGARITLKDLTANDMIWMLADPAGALPHDPITLLVDLSGKAKMLVNLFVPAQAETLPVGAPIGEIRALTLNNVTISAVGAEVTGEGAFTFDNTDMTTFPGMPRPMGDVTVNIKGANALLDKLIGMGLVPEDQAMMGRMMMGMFARTVGDDELNSKIEINKEGHVIANGQRIQ